MRTDALGGRCRLVLLLVPLLLFLSADFSSAAQDKLVDGSPQPVEAPAAAPIPSAPSIKLPDLTNRENFSSALQIVIVLTVLSLAPAILIMMTSFTRIVIVLSLLRQ